MRPPLGWELRATAAGVVLVLWYPPSAAAAAAATAGAPPYSPSPSSRLRPELPSYSSTTVQQAVRPQAVGSTPADLSGSVAALDAEQQPRQQQQERDPFLEPEESFMSSASQLQWSAATSFASAADGELWSTSSGMLKADASEGDRTDCSQGQSAAAAEFSSPVTSRRSSAVWCRNSGGSSCRPSFDEDVSRLELECTDIVINAIDGSNGGSVTLAARFYALAVLEYLPTSSAGWVNDPL